MRYLFLLLFLCSNALMNAQESLNFTDSLGQKQGHWIVYGKDRPESGIPADGKVEEGNYIDNRKEGTWIKYHDDGKTPKLKAQYANNRPFGSYQRFEKTGELRDSIQFTNSNGYDSLKRGIYPNSYDYNGQLIAMDSTQSNTPNEACRPPLPKLTAPDTRNIPFKPDGYNKVYNGDDEIWQDGLFKDGQLWDGKHYVYDRDGILLKVRIYKGGVYHSDGQL